jgi:hypothetical protein
MKSSIRDKEIEFNNELNNNTNTNSNNKRRELTIQCNEETNNNLILSVNELSTNTSPLRFNSDNVDYLNTSTMNTPIDVKSPRSIKKGGKFKDNSMEMPPPLSFNLKSASFSVNTSIDKSIENSVIDNITSNNNANCINEVNYIQNTSSQSLSLMADDSSESFILPSFKEINDSIIKDNNGDHYGNNKHDNNDSIKISINSNIDSNNSNEIEDCKNVNRNEIIKNSSKISQESRRTIDDTDNDNNNSSCLIM